MVLLLDKKNIYYIPNTYEIKSTIEKELLDTSNIFFSHTGIWETD